MCVCVGGEWNESVGIYVVVHSQGIDNTKIEHWWGLCLVPGTVWSDKLVNISFNEGMHASGSVWKLSGGVDSSEK